MDHSSPHRHPRVMAWILALVAAVLLATFSAQAQGQTITVAPGDTLSAIALSHGVSVQDLVRANGLADADLIVAGTTLRIDGAAQASTTGATSHGSTHAGTPSGGSHRVVAGETLDAIAARHGVTVTAIASANAIADPNLIIAGRSLSIPASGSASSQSSTSSGSSGSSGSSQVVSSRSDVAAMIDAAAGRHGVDPSLMRAIAWQESGWNQAAVSSAGAIGVMQLLPSTASWVGFDLLGRPLDPNAAADNIEGGAAFLSWLMRSTGDTSTAIGSYYQGLASVRSRGFYDDTSAYVSSVLALRGRV